MVEVACVDQGYIGPAIAEAAGARHPALSSQAPMAKQGFLLLPRRWVIEHSFAWATRFRHLARDYERLDITLKEFSCLIYLTYACLHVSFA